MLRFKSLGSGSSGNATVVQARDGAQLTHVLIDCGLGLRQLDQRLGQAGLLADQLDAIFITHEHGDHIGCARQLALRERIPVYMSHGTYVAIGRPDFEGLLQLVADGVTVSVGAMQLNPFTVPHDAREPLQLSCGDGAARLGVLTDLGHVSAHVLAQLQGVGTLLLECNHDPELLAASRYPPFLKQRVGGPWGHLANSDAADVVRRLRLHGLTQVVGAHLSEQNNRPELVQSILAAVMGCAPADITVADGASGCGWTTA